MTGVLVMFGGILLFAAVITFLDWLGRRKEPRHEKGRP
jgi:hypothetical protein